MFIELEHKDGTFTVLAIDKIESVFIDEVDGLSAIRMSQNDRCFCEFKLSPTEINERLFKIIKAHCGN